MFHVLTQSGPHTEVLAVVLIGPGRVGSFLFLRRSNNQTVLLWCFRERPRPLKPYDVPSS